MEKYFQTKSGLLPGTSYKEIYKNSQKLFAQIKGKSKRKPYIRSIFFDKRKVFFDYFWEHLMQKRQIDRRRRLKFLSPTLELVKNTRIKPTSKPNPNKKSEILHRFYGQTSGGEKFYVQIKEHKPSKTLQLMSILPK